MQRNLSLTVSLVVASLLSTETAAAMAVAQGQQKAPSNQTGAGETGKAAPKQRGDDDFSPKGKSKAKASAPQEAGEGEAAARDEGVAPAVGVTPMAEAAAPTTPAAASPTGSAPNKKGVARICLVTTRVQASEGDAPQAAEAVRNTFNSFLNGPTIETVTLAARLPSQAAEEARQSGCGYVLHTSLTHKKSGGGGLFGRAVSRVGSSVYIPGGSSVGGAAARSAATAGVYTAAELAGSIKAKDELVLDFRLEATDGARPTVAQTSKAKARADGEDLLTTLVERAADVIAAAVMR